MVKIVSGAGHRSVPILLNSKNGVVGLHEHELKFGVEGPGAAGI
jgi:hypothetical protein